MAGGKGGLKKKVRKAPAVAAAEQTKPKSPAKAKTAAAVAAGTSAAAAAAEEAAPGPMELDEQTTRTLKKEVKQHKPAANATKKSSVLYLGHIPHGFFEEEMKGFFSQFGDIKRLRLARNRKTGNSKHYAFIEFAVPEVAHIVAKAMNGYLMYNKLLVCHVMAAEDVHASLFKFCNKPVTKSMTLARERKRHNAERSVEEKAARMKRLVAADRKKRKRLAAAGIDYDFDGYASGAMKSETPKSETPKSETPKSEKPAGKRAKASKSK